jgi:RNA polymerase sigma-70 factor (ECF subfamily)
MTDVRDTLPSTNFLPDRVYVDHDADDHVLVARCLDGDSAAFEGVVDRYFKLDTFDPARRFFSWIYRILVNECLNVRRDRRADEPLTQELASVGSVADLLEASERKARVQAAIRSLPAAYREVIVLRHFAELSYEEIADALGVPTKTVKSRLYTARERLAQTLGLDARS